MEHGTPKGKVVYEAGSESELQVIHYMSDDGFETMLTHWYPDEDDIRRIIAGKPVALHIVGTRQINRNSLNLFGVDRRYFFVLMSLRNQLEYET